MPTNTGKGLQHSQRDGTRAACPAGAFLLSVLAGTNTGVTEMIRHLIRHRLPIPRRFDASDVLGIVYILVPVLALLMMGN